MSNIAQRGCLGVGGIGGVVEAEELLRSVGQQIKEVGASGVFGVDLFGFRNHLERHVVTAGGDAGRASLHKSEGQRWRRCRRCRELLRSGEEKMAVTFWLGPRAVLAILAESSLAYQKVTAIFSSPERKAPGTGGIFSILSRICARDARPASPPAVTHGAQDGWRKPKRSTPNTPLAPTSFDLLPGHFAKVLGLYNAANPADSKTATLRNMLMVRSTYDALVSPATALVPAAEKRGVLRSIAAVTEAYMRPVFHARATASWPRRRSRKARRGTSCRAQGPQPGGI